MRTARVAVLMGGPSSEHEISLTSGRQVAAALALGGPTDSITIERDGSWRFGQDAPLPLGAALSRLVASTDVVFPALHGVFGEDGTVQGLLEAAGLPYVGSRVAASALAMDKRRAKAIYRDAGLPTPRAVGLAPGDQGTAREPDWASLFPCVVKPSASGSSCGVSFPPSAEAARADAVRHLEAGLEVVVEVVVTGRELTCGVLEHEDGPRPLPVTEIVPTAGYAFFDYAAKYTPGATSEITPAEIADALREEVQALAVRAHRALGCRDMSRTDFLLDEGRPTLLETNTLPGFTPTSLLPQAAETAGMSFSALVEHLVARAAARGR